MPVSSYCSSRSGRTGVTRSGAMVALENNISSCQPFILTYPLSPILILQQMHPRAVRIFDDLDPLREGILQLLEMRDDQDSSEIFFNRLDDFDQPFAAFAVLRAEAFVQDQSLQFRTGAT